MIQGIELSLSNLISINDFLFPASLSFTFTDARFKNNFNSDFDPWGNVKINDELPYIPKKMLHLKLGVNKKNIQSYVRFKYVDKTRTVAGQGDFIMVNSTSSLKIFDLVTNYQLNKNISLNFKINNLTNLNAVASTRPAGFRPIMPRQYISSLIFDF